MQNYFCCLQQMQNCVFYFGNCEVSCQQLLLEVKHQAIDKQLFDICCKY